MTLPRTATETQETVDVTADNLAVAGLLEETSTAAPPEFDRAGMQELISKEVAASLVAALPALLPEMLKALVPNVGNVPSQVVPMGMVTNAAPSKPGWLKHYRRDDTISGKYQMVDVSKLEEDGELPIHHFLDSAGHARSESPAIMKGQWIHFVNGHFYAQTQKEVDFIEWRMRTDPQFRVYEDSGTGIIPCPVTGCSAAGFADEETLKGHLKATHGV